MTLLAGRNCTELQAVLGPPARGSSLSLANLPEPPGARSTPPLHEEQEKGPPQSGRSQSNFPTSNAVGRSRSRELDR